MAQSSTTTAKQSDNRSTLADRLESLRTGWGTSTASSGASGSTVVSDGVNANGKNASEPAALPIPEATARYTIDQSAVTSLRSAKNFTVADNTQIPRVDPRDLLPQNWRTSASDTASRSNSNKVSGMANGSARARMLRDARSEQAFATEERPATPRAGSVLSAQEAKGPVSIEASHPNRSGVITLTPNQSAAKPRSSKQRGSWATSALSRSIAAEVAQSMEPDTKGSQAAASVVEEKSAMEKKAVEATDNLVAEAPISPAALAPTLSESEEFAAANSDADIFDTEEEAIDLIPSSDESAIIATEAKPLTKLPFAIGGEDVYSTNQTTMTPAKMTPAIETISPIEESPTSYGDSDELLLTQKMPVIVYQVAGPRKMVVGREATYRVTLDNRGDAAADQLNAKISVPGWAEVMGSKVTLGNVNHEAISEQPREIFWKIPRLAGSQKATLDLRLVPRAGRPIELGVQWTHSPVGTQTMVEVQEPKLSMTLNGPEEVLYGKPQTFRLTINNPGTGTAEKVALHLTPPGSDESKTVSHDFGQLAAGESRSVEIELTAREAGQLTVNASATATGNLSANASKEILCRQAELAVDWRGPSERYTGAPATYFFRVRNPGTAVAADVVLTAQLPAGFELISSDKAKISKDGMATFQVGSLRPGDDRYYQLKCLLSKAGDNEIAIHAKASDRTESETITAVTNVIALADLKLDVLDPKGPVATGEEIEYQIRVTNRGTNAASDVSIIGLFSEGIEPHHVDGSPCTISDGRVTFDTIEAISAGEVRTFTIHARADQAGTHLFRAEVLCRDLEIKLAAEETTRFFEDEVIDVASQPGSRYGY